MKGRLLAFSLIGAGLLLLTATGAYYGYAFMARLGLDELTVVTERPSRLVSGTIVVTETEPRVVVQNAPASPVRLATLSVPSATAPAPQEPPSAPAPRQAAPPPVASTVQSSAGQAAATGALTVAIQAPVLNDQPEGTAASDEPVAAVALAGPPPLMQAELVETDKVTASAPSQEEGVASTPVQTAPSPAVAIAAGGLAEANGSSRPVAGEAEVVALFHTVSELPATERYTFVDPSPDLLPSKPARAKRLYIPALNLVSDVQDLALLTKSDRLEWETPKWVVGHIPVTGRPGVSREGWYFGHLQSPLRREGNVFRQLPQIPLKLKNGEIVQIVLETADRKFLYQVYKTDVVHQSDLAITNSGEQDITLVTCYPTLVYDHRLLVTAALVGVTES